MQQDVSDDAIAKIAQAVVTRLEPVVEAKFSKLEARLSVMELALAPVGGRTIHDIHNHLMVGADSLERLAGSYDKLCELVNTAMQNHQSHLALQRRISAFEDHVRGRLANVEQSMEHDRASATIEKLSKA